MFFIIVNDDFMAIKNKKPPSQQRDEDCIYTRGTTQIRRQSKSSASLAL